MLQPTVASAASACPRAETAALAAHPAGPRPETQGIAGRLFLRWIAWRLDRTTFTGSEALDGRLLEGFAGLNNRN